MKKLIWIAAATLLLAACGDDDDPAATTTTGDSTTSGVSGTTSESTPHAGTTTPHEGTTTPHGGTTTPHEGTTPHESSSSFVFPPDYNHGECEDLTRRTVEIEASASVEDILTAFVDAEEGDIIQFAAGEWTIDQELTLDQRCVTIRGAGQDETILDWEGTTAGKGIFVSGGADWFTAEDFAIRNTFDNGIEVRGTTGIILRRLTVEWTGGSDTNNGRYGVYPVQCSDLLMEYNIVRNAADAGVYVGQCDNSVIRWNLAEENVSGIQVENTIGADVYENLSYNNTLGILVHDLPDKLTTNGNQTRVFRNHIIANNFTNFSRDTDITVNIPRGTGMIILAREGVEVFDNLFENNWTVNLAVANYALIGSTEDEEFDPFPRDIYIHGNTFDGGGQRPENNLARPIGVFFTLIRTSLPDQRIPAIVWDGLVEEGMDPLANPFGICIGDDYDGEFLNLNLDPEKFAANDTGGMQEDLSLEIDNFRCEGVTQDATEMLARVGDVPGLRPTLPEED